MGELALPIRSPPPRIFAGGGWSDERLATAVARGDSRAFALLYQRHHQALYRYCRLILRDEHDAQDALQSAMTRAFGALRTRERELAVRPWLFRIAHNEAVTVLRRRRPTAVLTETLEPVDVGVENTLERRERFATLLSDLQELSERQRAALVMRELSGLSIEAIAGALCTSPGAAKQVLFEARGALHDLAEGRAMDCEQIRRAISDEDRRSLRGRRLRAHLRECSGCRDFQAAMSTRRSDLRALAPALAPAAASALLGRALAGGAAGHHVGGLALGSGGAVAGSGGLAGAGGLAGGSGVPAAGAGGLAAGSGGASAGSGGLAAGSGGASAGSGGLATGSGGLAAGSGGLATGSGGLAGGSTAVSLATKIAIGAAVAATAAGGARLALVHTRSGQTHTTRAHSVARPGAPLTAPAPATATGARTGGGASYRARAASNPYVTDVSRAPTVFGTSSTGHGETAVVRAAGTSRAAGSGWARHADRRSFGPSEAQSGHTKAGDRLRHEAANGSVGRGTSGSHRERSNAQRGSANSNRSGSSQATHTGTEKAGATPSRAAGGARERSRESAGTRASREPAATSNAPEAAGAPAQVPAGQTAGPTAARESEASGGSRGRP